MARRRRDKDDRTAGRDDTSVTKELRSWAEPSLPESLVRQRPILDMTSLEDRRHFHPLHDDRPALTFDGTPAHISHDPNVNNRTSKRTFNRPPRVSSNPLSVFREPARQIMVCVRRKQRTEILHAFKQTGRGKGGRKPPKKTWLSNIKCK